MIRSGSMMLVGLLVMVMACAPAAGERAVYINGARLPAATLTALETGFGTVVPDGRYWYDPYSGLWGYEGGPAAGQIFAGLDLGGRLQVAASNGDTGVFVNGRRLPQSELHALQQLVGPVMSGRYWLDPYGNAGLEGGPALVNLLAAQQARARTSGGWNRNTPGGNWGGDGECSYYSHPDGPSVMIGNC